MKSGTNHGLAHEYHPDNAIKARPFFLSAEQRKPKNINNDLGGTFGGPIVRNRLFFFVSYEGEFTRSVTGQFGSVPTAAMLSGDSSPTGATIYDPNTGNPDGSGKQPFPGNKIPPNQIRPIVRKLLPLVPAQNTGQFGANANNFYGNLPTKYNLQKIDSKIDFNATPGLRITGRIDDDPYSETQVPIFGPILGTSGDAGYSRSLAAWSRYTAAGRTRYPASSHGSVMK